MKNKVIIMILGLILLTSCNSKQNIGTISGGLIGGIIGSSLGKGQGRLLAAGIGALTGTLIGRQIGKSMDRQDQELAQAASHNALEHAPTGKSIKWNNPDNGHSGYTIPTKTYRENNQYCREYRQKIIIGGKQEIGYGKACRQPDGNWMIVQ